jgi:hypothetical protein
MKLNQVIALLRILIFWLIATGAIIFVIYQVSTFLFSTNSVRARLKRDIKLLNQQLKDFLEGLIPFSTDELKLLSAQSITKMSRKGVSIIYKGYLSTIYQEPLFAFAIINYTSRDQALMIVRSSLHEYRFHFVEDHIVLHYDDNNYGVIEEDGKLFDAEGKFVLAYLDYNSSTQHAVIMAHGSELAHLNLNDADGKPLSERAFSVFHEFVEKDSEKLIFLSLYQILLKPYLDKE